MIFSMDEPVGKFEPFDKLTPELQMLVFSCADNKTSFQGINREWRAKGSIKNLTIFTQDFCDIMYAQRNGQKHLIGILLWAAYNRNYGGVENILKNSGILERVKDRRPFHFIEKIDGKSHILDLAGIARHRNDKCFMILLQRYKVCTYPLEQTICKPTLFRMLCVAGHTKVPDFAIYVRIAEQQEAEQGLKLLVDFDKGKCVKVLLANSRFKTAVDRSIVERACVRHSLNALEELLQAKSFHLNEVRTHMGVNDRKIKKTTLLDDAIEAVERNEVCSEAIGIFRAHGAMKAAEIAEQEAKKREWNKEICKIQ